MAGSPPRERTSSDRRRRRSRSPGSTACVGRTCVTRPPSRISGQRCARGSRTQSSWPLTTRRSTGASFSRAVHGTGLRAPRTPFTCTVQLARKQWGIYPTKLPDVCRRLRIPLRHHDAGSDVEACARIVLAAEADKMTPANLNEAQRCARELEAASDAHGYFGRTSRGLVVGGSPHSTDCTRSSTARAAGDTPPSPRNRLR